MVCVFVLSFSLRISANVKFNIAFVVTSVVKLTQMNIIESIDRNLGGRNRWSSLERSEHKSQSEQNNINNETVEYSNRLFTERFGAQSDTTKSLRLIHTNEQLMRTFGARIIEQFDEPD